MNAPRLVTNLSESHPLFGSDIELFSNLLGFVTDWAIVLAVEVLVVVFEEPSTSSLSLRA